MISRNGLPMIGFGDASCAPNPAVPEGFAIWKGAVPPELTQWAIMLRDRIGGYPYGQLFSTRFGAIDVLARKDHHTWTYRKQPDGSATLAQNLCIPGITLYRPTSAPGVSGAPNRPGALGGALGADGDVHDPATAKPDPALALYPAGAPEPGTVTYAAIMTGLAAGLGAYVLRAPIWAAIIGGSVVAAGTKFGIERA